MSDLELILADIAKRAGKDGCLQEQVRVR